MSMQAPFHSLDPGPRLQARLLPDLQLPYSTEQHWRPLHRLSIRLLSTRLYLMLSSSGQIYGQRNNGAVILYMTRLLRAELHNLVFEAVIVVLLKTEVFWDACAEFSTFGTIILPLYSGQTIM
jgi:hypothetical protein